MVLPGQRGPGALYAAAGDAGTAISPRRAIKINTRRMGRGYALSGPDTRDRTDESTADTRTTSLARP